MSGQITNTHYHNFQEYKKTFDQQVREITNLRKDIDKNPEQTDKFAELEAKTSALQQTWPTLKNDMESEMKLFSTSFVKELAKDDLSDCEKKMQQLFPDKISVESKRSSSSTGSSSTKKIEAKQPKKTTEVKKVKIRNPVVRVDQSVALTTFNGNLELFNNFYTELLKNKNTPIDLETLTLLALFKNELEVALSAITTKSLLVKNLEKFQTVSKQFDRLQQRATQPVSTAGSTTTAAALPPPEDPATQKDTTTPKSNKGKDKVSSGEESESSSSDSDETPLVDKRRASGAPAKKSTASVTTSSVPTPSKQIGSDFPLGLENSKNACFLNVILQAIANNKHLQEAFVKEGDAETPLLRFLEAYERAHLNISTFIRDNGLAKTKKEKLLTAEKPGSKGALNEGMEVYLNSLSGGKLKFGRQEDVPFTFGLLFKTAQNKDVLTTKILDPREGPQEILGFNRLHLEADTGGCDTLDKLLDAYVQLDAKTGIASRPFLEAPELFLFAIDRYTQKPAHCVVKFTVGRVKKAIRFSSKVPDAVLSDIAGTQMNQGCFRSTEGKTQNYYFTSCGTTGAIKYWQSKDGRPLTEITDEVFTKAQNIKEKQEITVSKVLREKPTTGKHGGDISVPLQFTFKDAYSLGEQKGAEYLLYAIIVHKGSTEGSGHYVIYMRTSDGWWIADDNRVRQVTDQEAEQAAKQAYCFIAHKTTKK